jgi:DNA-binding NarL/FixJ family response regulator
MSIRVLVTDDHELVRSGIKAMLAGTDVDVVAEATSGVEAIERCASENFDVVLLDIRMPGGDGLQALARLRQDHPTLPVLMLTAFENPTYVARALALGATGYLLKETPREQLLNMIRRASRGEECWSRDELRRVTGALSTPRVSGDLDVPLTQRESEVLRQLAFGLTNKEIAQALNISFETVKEHVQHILRKIGVSDRTQAAVWAVRKGLV